MNERSDPKSVSGWRGARALLAPAPNSLVAWISLSGNRSGMLWFPIVNLLWLFWMVLAPWVFANVKPWIVWVTYLSIAVFLVLYQRAWYGSRKYLVHYTVAIAVLGLAIVPVNTSWSYVIYAASLIPFCARGWRAIGWVALLLLAFSAVAMATGYFTPLMTFGCALSTFVIALLQVAFRFNIERDAELRLSQDEVRRLAVMTERQRIGRDLHDLIGHTLSLVAIKSELARRLMTRDPAGAERELADIESVARRSLTEVRNAVTGLRSAELSGELASARLLLEAANIHFEFAGANPALTPEAEAAFAMGLREAVTNVQRHSRATRVDVRLVSDERTTELCVEDNGRGGAAVRGNGLAGMAERLQAQGGSLLLEAAPSGGTIVRMRVPSLRTEAA